MLVLIECVTSFTTTCFIESEQHSVLRDAIIELSANMCPLYGPPAVIRTDPSPGFVTLANDPILEKHNIFLEVGCIKKLNKNLVAEKVIQELELEIL